MAFSHCEEVQTRYAASNSQRGASNSYSVYVEMELELRLLLSPDVFKVWNYLAGRHTQGTYASLARKDLLGSLHTGTCASLASQ